MNKLRTTLIVFIAILLFFSCKHEAIVPDNNYLIVECDSIHVSYQNFVQTFMIQKSCILCHTDDMGFTPYLDSHDSIRAYVLDSTQASIFMEKITSNHKIVDTSKYNTSCDIAKLNNWIKSGAY